jgi:SNF2 family DNA or RNA helicase
MTTVLARPHLDGARLELQAFLGRRFADYLEAVNAAGARYVPSLRANVIALERLPALGQALTERGFELAVDSELRHSLDAVAEEAASRAAEGASRLAEAEARLADGVSLYPYQKDGIRWLAVRREALLGDQMGLGKTVQTLMALPTDARAIVIAPAAVVGTWLREAQRWRPDLRTSRVTRQGWRWPTKGEILLGTYGSLPAEDQELAPPPADMIAVADEAHLLKGGPGRRKADGSYKGGVRRVRRWQIVRDAVHGSNGRVWLLTGTPLLNRPSELWRVIEATGSGAAKRAFGSWSGFNQMLRNGRGSVEASPDLVLALQKVMLRRDRATVLPDLPRKRRQIEPTKIADPEALAACDELLEVLSAEGRGPEDLLEMGNLPSRVRAVVFELLSRVRAALAAAKTPRALEIAKDYEEARLPVVVFSQHLVPLGALAARPGWGLIDGSVSADDRAEVVRRFQDGELRGVACSYAAGGVGITLTRAHHVLCVDQPWTPAELQQGEDRCCRIGQEADSVHVRILAADHPVDLRVAELLAEKTRLIEATVEAAAVESVGPDDALADQAQKLAMLAESTAPVMAKLDAERARREADAELVKSGEEDRRAGRFEVGALPDVDSKRGPSSAVEAHAAAAMVRLAELDPDHARVRNGVGFSQFDGEFGRSLARQLVARGRLSPKQWAAACKLAHRYRGQIGEPPLAE